MMKFSGSISALKTLKKLLKDSLQKLYPVLRSKLYHWWFQAYPEKRNFVPVIYATVILFLLAAAFLIPVSESHSLAFSVLNIIKNIKFSLPEINLTSIFRLHLPSFIIYIFIGILILTLFDRALFGIFHREK